MEEVFEPITAKQAEATENQQNQIQIQQQAEKQLRDSTQTTTQEIENQTRAIQHSSDILIIFYRNELNTEYKNVMH